MIALKVKIDGLDAVKARMAALQRGMGEVTPIVEMAAVDAVQEHLRANYLGKPNKLGGASTGYWAGVLGTVTGTHTDDAASVSLRGAGLRMKWEGGTVKPSGRISSVTGKPIKFLAIPAAAESHGKVPAMFGTRLYAIKGERGGVLKLMVGETQADSDPVMFWLSRSARIKADKNILPPAATVARLTGEAAALYLTTLETPTT